MFPVPENANSVRLYLQNLGRGGTLTIDDVSVIPVAPKTSAIWFSLFFALGWVSALAFCLLALTPREKRSGTGALTCTLIIITGVVLPGEPLEKNMKSGRGDLAIDLAGILFAASAATLLTLPARLRNKTLCAHSG